MLSFNENGGGTETMSDADQIRMHAENPENPGQARYFLFPVAILQGFELHAASSLASPAPGHGPGFTWSRN
jgi:hypothetical protein